MPLACLCHSLVVSLFLCRTLPLASGPNTSTTRPRGTPPIPSAASSDKHPVGMTPCVSLELIKLSSLLSPSRIIDPEPCDFSICSSAASSARSFAADALVVLDVTAAPNSTPRLPALPPAAISTPSAASFELAYRLATAHTLPALIHHRDDAANAITLSLSLPLSLSLFLFLSRSAARRHHSQTLNWLSLSVAGF